MAGYQERPHFLLEFAPGGSRHEELVVTKPEEDLRAEETSTLVNELPSKIDDFLEVKFSFVQQRVEYIIAHMYVLCRTVLCQDNTIQ